MDEGPEEPEYGRELQAGPGGWHRDGVMESQAGEAGGSGPKPQRAGMRSKEVWLLFWGQCAPVSPESVAWTSLLTWKHPSVGLLPLALTLLPLLDLSS